MPQDNSDLTPTEKDLGQFFDTIWHDTVGWVYVPVLTRAPDKKDDVWSKKTWQWPLHRTRVIKHALKETSLGKDVYYAPAIFKEAGKVKKEDVLGSWVVWSEFDGNAPEWSDYSSSASQEGTDGIPVSSEQPSQSPVPPPTLRVASSIDGREHCYWALGGFSTDLEWLEGVNRSITYATRADTSGWDLSQVLRPPYTVNYKYDHKPPVTIISNSGKIYNKTSFAGLKPIIQLVSDTIDVENLPKAELVSAKYSWTEEDYKFFLDNDKSDRSAALMRLGFIAAEMGMNDTEIYAIVENADSRWGKYINRLDRKGRLLDIVNRARIKHPHGLGTLTFAGLTGDDTDVEEGEQYVFTFKEFLDHTLNISWSLEGVLEAEGIAVISSAPGVGKTQFTLQMAIACALGIPFLGYVPVKPMRITFLSLEMSHMALLIFMRLIVRHYSPEQINLLDENLIIVPLGEALQLEKELPRAWLNTLLEETKPDGLMIDSIGKLTLGDLNSVLVSGIMNHLKIVGKKFKCFTWLIHHNRKATESNKEPTSLDDVMGTTYVTTDATLVLLLYRKQGEEEIKMYSVKNRLSVTPPVMTLSRDENLYFTDVSTVTFNGLTKEGEKDGDLFAL